MKFPVIFIAISMIALSGCASDTIIHEYNGHKVTVDRLAFATNLELGRFKFKSDKECVATVEFEKASSDQAEAFGKAVEGAVTAIMSAAP